MFELSAEHYDKIYGFLDYDAAAANLRDLIARHHPSPVSLLDVACGTGAHLERLAPHFRAEGLDILPALLEKAKQRCPGIPFHVGDMTDFHLGRTFDVVTCLFCSIGYLTDLDAMERAIARMAAHLNPGGLLVVEPWVTPEQCWTNRITKDFLDEPELKIARMYTHEKVGNTSVFDIHCLVGTPERVEHFVEREVMGLFTHEEYREAFRKAGLSATRLETALFPGHAYGVWLGRAPA